MNKIQKEFHPLYNKIVKALHFIKTVLGPFPQAIRRNFRNQFAAARGKIKVKVVPFQIV